MYFYFPDTPRISVIFISRHVTYGNGPVRSYNTLPPPSGERWLHFYPEDGGSIFSETLVPTFWDEVT